MKSLALFFIFSLCAFASCHHRPEDCCPVRNLLSSLKKTYEALKNFGDLNELELEDSAWGIMAVETIIEVFEGRQERNIKRS